MAHKDLQYDAPDEETQFTSLLECLIAQGHAVTRTENLSSFERLASRFGRLRPSRLGGPTLDHLRVTPKRLARGHTHSARNGCGGFPFHTDTAHWRRPARTVLLRASVQTSRPTVLVNLRKALKAREARTEDFEGLFTIADGRRSFLAPAWDIEHDYLRYDPSCMRPSTRKAERAALAIEEALNSAPKATISWDAGLTLVIDNWSCAHARSAAGEAASVDDQTRELVRAQCE